MLKLTCSDKKVIDTCYKKFLMNLKELIKINNVHNPLECYKIIISLLKRGKFSVNDEITLNEECDFLHLPNIISNGIYVMSGTYCCRHVNNLIKDILEILNFNVRLLYVNVDEDDNWRITTPVNSNHVVVLLKLNDDRFILDAYNDFVLKLDTNNNLIPINIETIVIKSELYDNYKDSNIEKIDKILKKYYKLKIFNIQNTYDYI